MGIALHHAPTTPEIAHDASASDMEELLEILPSIGQVWFNACVVTCSCSPIRHSLWSTTAPDTKPHLLQKAINNYGRSEVFEL